ncbi:MAG: nucleotide sugar dehydrogenase [Anaerolineales bacterium]|nr:nucleotide sugar dehydrogenase [Anaerolineales bacterium]MCX7754596.1 nucleotide sugar dehydrogenase [Anaerolineales bacterium]MDW8278123.1 nucleotide sugar dehydrogenase [Anaerolineales bacterium]
MKFNKICILGLGYIGLPTATMFAANGVKVVGVDTNPHVIETLRAGRLHIHEPGLGEMLQKAIASGNLSVASAPEPADAFLIAVPTPFYENQTGEYRGQPYKKADMRAVTSATEAIVPHLRKGNLVVLESTSPPRTTVDLVVPILETCGLKAGSDFYVAYSPERVLPGQILRELVENARVIGGITPESAQAGVELYATFVRGPIHPTDATTAEMVKLMENTYRDVNIAIANEFARLAERFGVDVWEAIRLASLHPRVKILNPGPGVGGHCISVDPWFFVETAPDLAQLIWMARRVNDEQPHFVVEKVRRAFGQPLNGKRIAALGLAYKADVDDLRESPAVEVVHLLQQEGAVVTAFEPYKPENGLPGIHSAMSLEAALQSAEAVLFLVGHTQFRALTPAQLAALTPARILIDTVNVLTGSDWTAAGFQLWRLGAEKRING